MNHETAQRESIYGKDTPGPAPDFRTPGPRTLADLLVTLEDVLQEHIADELFRSLTQAIDPDADWGRAAAAPAPEPAPPNTGALLFGQVETRNKDDGSTTYEVRVVTPGRKEGASLIGTFADQEAARAHMAAYGQELADILTESAAAANLARRYGVAE